MSEYAPTQLVDLGKRIAATFGGTFSGVVGDSSHTYGYHRSRNTLKKAGKNADYSIQLPDDKAGDGDAASAIDINFSSATMRALSGHLLAAGRSGDPRMRGFREFFGTTDGKTVTGWDYASGKTSTADSTHLWHIHLSVLRRYSRDSTVLAPIIDVLKGQKMSDVWEKMIPVSDWGQDRWPSLEERIKSRTALGSSYLHARAANDNTVEILGQIKALRDEVAEIKSMLELCV